MEEGGKKGSDAPSYTTGDRKSRKTALAVWRAGQAVQHGCSLCVAAGLPCVQAKGYATCARCTGKAVGQARCIRPGPASRASVLSRVKTGRVSRCVGPVPACSGNADPTIAVPPPPSVLLLPPIQRLRRFQAIISRRRSHGLKRWMSIMSREMSISSLRFRRNTTLRRSCGRSRVQYPFLQST